MKQFNAQNHLQMGVTLQCWQLRILDPIENIKAGSQGCQEGSKTDQGNTTDHAGTNRHTDT